MAEYMLHETPFCSHFHFQLIHRDYLTKVDENKRVWGFKKMVVARTKLIPLLLLLVSGISGVVMIRPLPIAYEMLKGLF